MRTYALHGGLTQPGPAPTARLIIKRILTPHRLVKFEKVKDGYRYIIQDPVGKVSKCWSAMKDKKKLLAKIETTLTRLNGYCSKYNNKDIVSSKPAHKDGEWKEPCGNHRYRGRLR